MEVISKQGRRFQLTLNQVEHYDIVKEYLMSRKSFKYLLSCKETAPTPVIVKCGNFKVQGDILWSYEVTQGITARPLSVTFFLLFVPEGVTVSDSLIGAHPEWIMGWTAIDVGIQLPSQAGAPTGGSKFSLTTRLKRNLNSGDRVVAILQCRQYITAQAVFTCQYWTCAN